MKKYLFVAFQVFLSILSAGTLYALCAVYTENPNDRFLPQIAMTVIGGVIMSLCIIFRIFQQTNQKVWQEKLLFASISLLMTGFFWTIAKGGTSSESLVFGTGAILVAILGTVIVFAPKNWFEMSPRQITG